MLIKSRFDIPCSDQYLSYLCQISKCLGQFPDHLLSLTAFELKIVEYKLQSNKRFLSYPIVTQRNYLAALHYLIKSKSKKK